MPLPPSQINNPMQFKPSHPEWTDWKWQHAHHCTDFETLAKWMQPNFFSNGTTPKQFKALTNNYRMGITPYYFNLIKAYNYLDPIFRQIVPHPDELHIHPDELEDPISDEDPGRGSRPLKALIHRYPNRVLLIPTAQCAVYCRFCFRKRLVGDSTHNAHSEDLEAAYTYIEDHPEIEEVILTGGDPLTLGDRQLEMILSRLSKIPSVRVIRIHSRLPVVNPFRLTPELGTILSQIEKPVWISTHFNHSQEITPIAINHIQSWIQMGIPFLNQSVLLKGVNDSSEILKQLLMNLITIKVKPYYLHQADLVQGTSHLRVPIERGLDILKQLQGEVPGYALPHYILYRPGGTGKVPLQNHYKEW